MGLKADYRWYVSLEAVKRELEITHTDHDAMLKDFIAQASDTFERMTKRHFIPVTATYDYDWEDSLVLFLRDDLLSVTTLSDDSGTIEAADYVLYGARNNPNNPPYFKIVLNSTQDFFYYNDVRQKAISVAGEWGYCNDYEDTGATVIDNPLSNSATTLEVAFGKLETGWSLLIGSEQIFVFSIAEGTNDTATIKRAQGGTIAAQHAAGTTIYRYVPPGMVTRAVSDWVKMMYQTRPGEGVKREQIGDYAIEYQGELMPKNTAATIKYFQRPRIF